jgi:hypothetical protein
MENQNLGPAERIINSLTQYLDHAYHGRPGIVTRDNNPTGVKWEPVTTVNENGSKVVFKLTKLGKKSVKTRLGILQSNNTVTENNRVVGEFRNPGLFPEVVSFIYAQIAEVWKLDNEFAARWASYAFAQSHRDMKVILAAFMLVQSRAGKPVMDNGQILFRDEDFREVGEAMILSYDKNVEGIKPNLLIRMYEILTLPQIAKINRDLGFGVSSKNPFTGRWVKTVEKWLRYREENVKLFDGLIKAGFRKTLITLARLSGYKPSSELFFEKLRWKQVQSKDGHRSLALNKELTKADSWESLTEEDICKKIVSEKISFKVVAGKLPKNIGLTPAIMAASVESGSLSDKDLIIYTPTLEELGLLKNDSIKARWEKAVKVAEDQRAASVIARVKSKDVADKLQEASDNALKKAVEEVSKGLRIYFIVDISGSMQGAIEKAKEYVAKFLQAFPLDKLHVSVFNTSGREITIKHASAAGVQHAFSGINAGGGTDYGAGVRALRHHVPAADEDALFIFVGDEEAGDFQIAVRNSGLNPVGFGLLKIGGSSWSCVRNTARELGIPCFNIDQNIFSDVYAVPRVIRNLIASTPISAQNKPLTYNRETLVDVILKTPLLKKPAWATV